MNGKTMAVVVLLSSGAGLLAAGPEVTVTKAGKVGKLDRSKFVNEPGWAWLMWPQELRLGEKFGLASDAGIVSGYSHVDAGSGALRVFFVHAGRDALDIPPIRLVVFDAEGKRYLPERGQSGGLGSHGTQLSDAIYTLSPKTLPPGKVTRIGIERMAR